MRFSLSSAPLILCLALLQQTSVLSVSAEPLDETLFRFAGAWNAGVTADPWEVDELLALLRGDWVSPAALQLITIPAGSFMMGNTGSERDQDCWCVSCSCEGPRHEVELVNTFEMAQFEVSNAQFVAVLNWALSQGYLRNSSGGAYGGGNVYHGGKQILALVDGTEWWEQCFIGYTEGLFFVEQREGVPQSNHPAIRVSWYGATAFCNWLSEQEELAPCYDLSTWTLASPHSGGYRLPSEAEWEYACRGPATNPNRYNIFPFGDDTSLSLSSCGSSTRLNTYMVWCGNSESDEGTKPVGSRDPQNGWGLHDLCGNVMEWCGDWWHDDFTDAPVDGETWVVEADGNYRVVRGGAWNTSPGQCRTATRYRNPPGYWTYFIGFRVVRSP